MRLSPAEEAEEVEAVGAAEVAAGLDVRCPAGARDRADARAPADARSDADKRPDARWPSALAVGQTGSRKDARSKRLTPALVATGAITAGMAERVTKAE